MPESKAYVIAMLVVFIFGIASALFITYVCFVLSYNYLPQVVKIAIVGLSFMTTLDSYWHYKKAYKSYKRNKENE